jgi:hypothetical protein
MYTSHNDDTDRHDTRGDGWPDEDPSVAWIRLQIDQVFGTDQADPATEHRLTRIAVTTCVLIFLILLITLALVAPQ